MPTNAPEISCIDLIAASLGESFSCWIRRSTFSTTTMASSTSRPIASTMPNRVSVLMVNPARLRMANAPSSTTGTAMVGMRTTFSLVGLPSSTAQSSLKSNWRGGRMEDQGRECIAPAEMRLILPLPSPTPGRVAGINLAGSG
jgi:hypothetical protein